RDDNRRAGLLSARLARLFRLLPNARGAGRPHSLGPVATARCAVAAVENTTSPSCRAIALQVSGALLNTAASGRGPWNIARGKAPSGRLSNPYFKSLGLPSLIEAR